MSVSPSLTLEELATHVERRYSLEGVKGGREQAADALRRLAQIQRVLARIPVGAQLHITPPQSWHPAGDPLWRAWVAGTGKWGEGSDGITALVMLADALEQERP